MTLNRLASRLGRLVSDNSPVILTAIGVTGTLTTAYLTGRASFKAAELIREVEEEHGYAEDPKIRFKIRVRYCKKLYIPAASSAVLTVAAIICASRIGTRRAAAFAAAYSVTERAFEEYKNKVVERVGAKKEQGFRDELAQERIRRDPVECKEVIFSGKGTELCYETFTGKYFESDMETLRKAQNDINKQILDDGYASLTDFYNLIGLPNTVISDRIGWNSDQKLELSFSATITDTGRPCMCISFKTEPIAKFNIFS